MSRNLCRKRFSLGKCVRVLPLLLLAAGAGVLSAAEAPTYPPVGGYKVTQVVKYDDLDLHSAADTRKLYRRLERTVRTVCDARRAYDPEYIKAVIRPCVTTSLKDAVTDINAPLLTEYHRKQVGPK